MKKEWNTTKITVKLVWKDNWLDYIQDIFVFFFIFWLLNYEFWLTLMSNTFTTREEGSAKNVCDSERQKGGNFGKDVDYLRTLKMLVPVTEPH